MEEGAAASSYKPRARQLQGARPQSRFTHCPVAAVLLVYVLLSLTLSAQPLSRLAPCWPGLST